MNAAVGSQSSVQVPAQIEVAVGLPSALSSGSDVAVGSPGEKEMQLESPQGMQIDSTEREISAPGTNIKLLPGDSSNSPKKFRACTEIPLNSTKVDTLEAAIIDLEELANKLTWLKEILKFGMPLSNSSQPLWKFVEHRGASMPK